MPSSVDEPRAPSSPHDLLAEVHRRADRRRRRTRLIGGATLAAFALIVAGVLPLALRANRESTTRVGGPEGTTPPGSVPAPTGPFVLRPAASVAPPPTLPGGLPETFVATGPDDSISVAATDGSGVRRSFRVPLEGGTWLEKLRVSPDRRTAYFVWGGGYCSPRLESLSLEDGRRQTLFDGADRAGISSLALSPDGTYLAMAVRRAGCRDGTPHPMDVVVRDLTTGAEKVIFSDMRLNEPNLSFSADGRRIAFEAAVSSIYDFVVHVVDIETGAVQQVPNSGKCHYTDPHLVPDGGLLLAIEDCWTPPPGWEQLDPMQQATEWFKHHGGDAQFVLVDPATGRVVRTVHEIPATTRIRWYQLDAGGEHVLYQAVNGNSPDLQRLALADGTVEKLYPPPQPEANRVDGHSGGDW